MPTPFKDGEVDTAAIRGNVRKWMAAGLGGVLACGTNGEATLLEDDEADRVIEAARQDVPRDRVLLAGAGHESTRATISAAKRAAAVGADAVLIKTPSVYKAHVSPAGLIAHYTAVADASPVPVLLYNLPGVTGISLTLPIVARLAEHPNIPGMKETSNDLERLGQFVALAPDRFRVFIGWAPVVYPALVSGATGAILAVANVLPDACVALYNHVRTGRHSDALALQQRLTHIAQLVTTVHGVAGLKAAMEQVGHYGGPVRAPLLAASDKARQDVEQALRAFAG